MIIILQMNKLFNLNCKQQIITLNIQQIVGGYNCFGQFCNSIFHRKLSVPEEPEDHIFIVSSVFPLRKVIMIFLKLVFHFQN